MDGSKEPVDAITIVVPTKMRKGESPFFYLQQHHSLHKGFFQNNHVNHIVPLVEDCLMDIEKYLMNILCFM